MPSPEGRRRTFRLLVLVASRELRITWLLFKKELRELVVSRALWAMVLISAPLVGFSFLQAVRLYAQSSSNAARLPQLTANLSPLDGIIVPTFGAVYLMNTFLLPFVAIRLIGNEKQTGALKLVLQLPIGVNRLVAVKLAALSVGWTIALVPTLSALAIWGLLLGGHVYWPELLTVVLGHALYAFVIAGVAFLAAAVTDSSATAAIVALSFTLGSWILEFAGATGSGLVRAVAAFSLSPALRGLERGLLGSPTALTLLVLGLGFVALSVVWLPPGVSRRQKLVRTGAVMGVAAQAVLLAVQLPLYVDVSENQRNSFNAADQRELRTMPKELKVNVNLAANDSRLTDLDRNVLGKLQRSMPHVTITYAETNSSNLFGGTSGANYGLVTYTYGGKEGISRATTAREVLPLIEALDGRVVVEDAAAVYPGYPLVSSADAAWVWFYALLPLLAIGGWWWCQRAPSLPLAVATTPVEVPTRLTWLAPWGRLALGAATALLALQLVPYGRSHTNLVVRGPTDGPAVAAAAQQCPTTFTPSTQSTMTLGAFRTQVNGMLAGLDGVLRSLPSGDAQTLTTQYGQFTVAYAGVSREVAELYPVRCQRLIADRLEADAAVLLARPPNGVAAGPSVVALRAGLASLASDLSSRVQQASPDALVGNQDPAAGGAVSSSGVPAWDTERTSALVSRTCAACHSNQPGWPWYANVAPVSWLVQHDVDGGRAVLNFSEWDRPQPAAAQAAMSVLQGRMPPPRGGLLNGELRLTDAERADLARGLEVSLNTPNTATAVVAPGGRVAGPGSATLLATLGTALAALGFAFGRSRRLAVPVAMLVLASVGAETTRAQTAAPIVETFTEEQLGAAPTSFSTPTGFWSIGTAGGADNKPVLFEDGTQWSGSQAATALANQAKSLYGDRWAEFIDDLPGTAYFPIALFNQVPDFSGGSVTTRVAVVGGDVDQDAGIVFDYQPNGDMIALRIDTQENNMILTQWVQGQPSELKRMENVPTALSQWHDVVVTVSNNGTHVTGSLDEVKFLETDLDRPVSGRVGAWAKTDTVVLFDSFSVDPNAP